MPAIAIGIWTMLLIGVCVWASVTQESDPTLITEGGSDLAEEPTQVGRLIGSDVGRSPIPATVRNLAA